MEQQSIKTESVGRDLIVNYFCDIELITLSDVATRIRYATEHAIFDHNQIPDEVGLLVIQSELIPELVAALQRLSPIETKD